MPVSDYSTTPADNTSISGLGVTDATVANTLDNIIRQLMADIRAADNANVKLTGNQTIAGDKTITGAWTLSAATLANIGSSSAYTATTSGTAFDFTGLPSGVTRIDIAFIGVSLSGTNSLLVQLGDSGGVETTGYNSTGEVTGGSAVNFTTGLGIPTNGAATGQHGILTLILADAASNTWAATYTVRSGDGAVSRGGGSKSLSSTLDRVRLTRSASDTFDAGSVAVRWSKI